MKTKTKKVRKPSLPPFFARTMREMNARAITLDQLHALGYAPTGEDLLITEDEGRSSLLEVADLDDGRIADFSVVYCFTAGYGFIFSIPLEFFSGLARKVVQALMDD